jgi:ABC-type transport system involved in multi-copper enzyme maturation permease subunit
MLRRELALVLRARVTWLQAAIAALLVGHGFVLAVDLYTAGSRSAAAGTLMASEFDPLLGIVRPTLGGLYLALSLFGPLVGARALAIEKDRRTFHTLLLQSGSLPRVLVRKWIAAMAGAGLPIAGAAALPLIWLAVGGHLRAGETAVAFIGYLSYAAFVTAVGIAAGSFASNFAQAATAALLAIAATFAIDAAEGFSALAWMGGAAAWSPTGYLHSFEEGTFAVSSIGWFAGATVAALFLAGIGCRFDLHGRHRAAAVTAGMVVLVGACMLGRKLPGAWDVTESRRHSLPPAAAREIAKLPGHLEIDADLDREDSRRRQLELDTLAKLRLARPDLRVRWLPDERRAPSALDAGGGYGQLTIRLGDRSATTSSTSRRELVTLIFELAGRRLPDWSQPEYPGYPLVTEGGRRTVVLAASYFVLPALFLLIGVALTRPRRRPI